MLLWRDKPYLIDLSQVVLTSHPDAERLLRQDLEKIEAFFVQRGLDLSRFRQLEKELLAFVSTSRDV